MKEKIKKERSNKNMKGKRGITLIALIITIIVMLILVAVTINVAISSGLFGTAKKAVRKTDIAKLQEEWMMTKYADYNTTTGRTNVSDGPLSDVFGDKYEQYNDQFEIKNGELIFTGTNEEVKQYAIELGIDVSSSVPQDNWPLLATIAKAISNDNTITNATKTATVKVDGTNYKLNVGDTFEVRYNSEPRTVRILGFNHDELSEETKSTAYGEETATGKAGISFEFVDFMTGTTGKAMNVPATNEDGWTATAMRTFLEGEDGIGKLSNNSQIKQVNKQYIKTFNVAKTQISNDKLWLLSCSEIWANGYQANAYGYAIAKEGDQYKYYADINPIFDITCSSLVKSARDGTTLIWWLRSTGPRSCVFNSVNAGISDGGMYAHNPFGVVPGFSI